jgi:hypothetical protein
MNNTVRNVLGIIVGVIIGGVVNGGIVVLGPMIIPPPEGVDMTTVEGMSAGMHLLGPLNFIAPFLARALRTSGILRCGLAQDYRRVLCRWPLPNWRYSCLDPDSRSILVYCTRSNRGLPTDGLAGDEAW